MQVICTQCGTAIKRRPSEVKEKNFCSKMCYRHYLISMRYIRRNCKVCGREFNALRSEVTRGKGVCCSLKCVSALSPMSKKRKPIQTCQTCGKSFRARSSELKRGKARFCSNKCYGVWVAENRSGANNCHFTPRIIKKCIICGAEFGVTKYFSDQKTCSRYCNTQYATKFNKFSETKIEMKLKDWLIKEGIEHIYQKKVGSVAFPDFLVGKVCIFADGDYWHKYPYGTDKDKKQDEELRRLGYSVLRFWEHDINNNFDYVTGTIKQMINGTN